MQIVHAGKTDAVLLEQPWPERTRHVTSENGRATTTTILQLTTTLDDVLNPIKEGQASILLWDEASTHASEPTLAAKNFTLSCCASFRSFKSCIQAQASATLARSVLDGSFDDVVMNKAWRRQSSAERAVTELCDKNQLLSTGWRQLRARSDDDFREAVAKANELPGDLIAKQIEPELAPEDPAEASDDAPVPDAPAPPQSELIDMLPTPASARPIDVCTIFYGNAWICARRQPTVILRVSAMKKVNAWKSSQRRHSGQEEWKRKVKSKAA